MAVSSNEDLKTQQSLKVLVADDDAPTRILLRAAISQWGYEVVEAKDGEHAWELLHTGEPARLLILDWLMPKLDGVALCERIKREFKNKPYMYIILLTQLSGTTNIVKGLEAGADEFLSKPFNMAELRSRLSVGARIVTFENQLAIQTQKLDNIQKFLNTIAQQLNSLSSKEHASSSEIKIIIKSIEDFKITD